LLSIFKKYSGGEFPHSLAKFSLSYKKSPSGVYIVLDNQSGGGVDNHCPGIGGDCSHSLVSLVPYFLVSAFGLLVGRRK